MPEGTFLSRLRDDPATKDLLGALGTFAGAQAGAMVTGIGAKATGQDKDKDKDKSADVGDDDGDDGDGDGASKIDQIKGGAVEGAGEAMGEGKSKIWGGIKGALKGLFKTGGSAKRPTNIYEQVFVGVPVEQAYANWTEYSKFPEFMKGPESVKVNQEEGEDGEVKETHQWTAKIFLNRRSWKATVEEDVENSRIRWSTEAPKGSIDGAISFTPIGDNATLLIYTLEYRPKGFFEWWGNRWRTVGRRARLDVKHFGRYVMMQDQTQDEEEPTEEENPDEAAGPGEADVVEPEDQEELGGTDASTDEPVGPEDEDGTSDADSGPSGEEDQEHGEEGDVEDEVDDTPEAPETPDEVEEVKPVKSERRSEREPRQPRQPREPRNAR